MKLVHYSHCSVSKQKLSVVSLCMTEGDTPFGEYVDHLSWKNINRSCKGQSQEIGVADFLLVFVKIVVAGLLYELLSLYSAISCTCAITWLRL